jgi:methylenetetrahydrofolate reductase (NADPH)
MKDHEGAAPRGGGKLEAVLKAGQFALTAETAPPDSADPEAVLARTGCLKGLADAVNVLDGPGAQTHLSPLAAAAILARAGIEPVLQFTMRDRNRLALQADILGAAALGIPNILCLTGDSPEVGDQPEAKPVFDLGSAQFMEIVRGMRDQACYPGGRAIETPPRLFIGGADTPRKLDADFTPDGLNDKIAAGADFFQTQYCFDMAVLRAYIARLGDFGILERSYFIIGIGPIGSARSARWMNENLFGVDIPGSIITRLEQAKDAKAEGRKICVELIQQLQEIEGVAGVHLMAPSGEQAAADIIRECGVLKGRAGASR